MLSDQEIKDLLHPKERGHFILAICALAPIAIVMAALIIGSMGLALIYFALAYFAVWFVQGLIRANYLAHNARVDEHSFAGVHAIVEQVRRELDYDKPFETFVVEDGSFNCLLMPYMKRKVLVINSGLLDQNVSSIEVKWVVARFVGSLRAKSYRLSIIQALISISERLLFLNVLLYPYERAVVMSGDRLGLALIGGDIKTAINAMNRLCVGATCGPAISRTGIAKQERDLKGVFGTLVRLISSHPPLVHRYRELLSFARERYPNRIGDLAEQTPAAPEYDTNSEHHRSAA